MAGIRSEKLKRGIQLVQGGMTYSRAAMIVGVSAGNLYSAFVRHDIEKPERKRGGPRVPHLDIAASLVANGATFREAAKIAGTTPSCVWCACQVRGIQSQRRRQSKLKLEAAE